MDIVALIIGILIAAGLIAFIGQPLRRARHSTDRDSELDTLLARRESLYTQIRELDFDHATGKVTDADYAPLRATLVADAADTLRQIDGLVATLPEPGFDDLEAAIAARRKKSRATVDEDLEAAIAARRRLAPAGSAPAPALVCHHCGKPLSPADAFCSRCGTPVATQVAR